MTFEVRQTRAFHDWITGLADGRAVEKVALRIVRLQAGNFGDHKWFGKIGELRIDHGPGYRIYICRKGDVVYVLLCGGDKSTQSRDIERAEKMAREI